MEINNLVSTVHEMAVDHGWWDDKQNFKSDCEPHYIAAKLSLVHSEVSEAVEVLRNPILSIGERKERFGEELADVVIRIADLCGFLGIDLDATLTKKMDINDRRPYRHGGKML